MNWFERRYNDVLIHPCMLDYMLYIIFKHITQNILALIIDWFTCQCMDAWDLPEKPDVYLHASFLLIIQSWVKYLLVVACKCHIPFSITRMSYKYHNNGRRLKDVCWVGIIAIDLKWLYVNLFCFYFKMHPRNSFWHWWRWTWCKTCKGSMTSSFISVILALFLFTSFILKSPPLVTLEDLVFVVKFG